MGDQHQRGAGLGAQAEQQVHHRIAGGLIEIAGRLIGQQQPGPRGEGAGERHALLLAAGELPGQMGQPMRQPDRTQRRPRPVRGVADPGKLQRHRDILQRGHGRDQVERLEHDADRLAPQPRQRVLVHRRDRTVPPA